MDALLEVRNLVKKYPSVTAVNGISFSITPGTCIGLLGPNGAGKTSTLEMIEGIIQPTAGEILYKGHPRTKHFREEIGIQFQTTSILSFLTVRETLVTFSRLFKHTMDLEELADLCKLREFLDRDHEKISGGQSQRLMLALALINDPELIFLDEPTTGLDPQARRDLWDLVNSIKSRGKTIVITTHYMEEAEQLCNRVAIINKGVIIADGSPEELLKANHSGQTVSIPAGAFPEHCLSDLELNDEGAWKLFHVRGRYEFHTDDIAGCLLKLSQCGADLSHMEIRPWNLEDLFLQLTGGNQS